MAILNETQLKQSLAACESLRRSLVMNREYFQTFPPPQTDEEKKASEMWQYLFDVGPLDMLAEIERDIADYRVRQSLPAPDPSGAFALKRYQINTLDALCEYFQAIDRLGDAGRAFEEITAKRMGRAVPYRPVREIDMELPYVCLRIPTGGGKTLVACHAIALAAREYARTDTPVVLWLSPSTTIEEQTREALKNRRHPYRRALDAAFSSVEILALDEARSATPAVLRSGATIIAATIQAFRVDDTAGRKVYESSGALMEHFAGLSAETRERLEKDAQGNIPFSLANVLRLHRPVVIVDEAHNTRTDLSFETLRRLAPSLILEMTATPALTGATPSNVLHTVSAAELKAEEMVKLPILLTTDSDWRTTLQSAIAKRNELETVARREQETTGEYIRPIALIQAQRANQERTVEFIEKYLTEEEHIPAAHIAIATGARNELYGMDVLSPSCEIRYVITINQLREGWDCPFAYVLASVANVNSGTSVEQLLGRVMRLPRARRKVHGVLNEAHAFVTSNSFKDVAGALIQGLTANGFEKIEAQRLIVAPSFTPSLPFETGIVEPASAPMTVTLPETEGFLLIPDEITSIAAFNPVTRALSISQPLSEAHIETVSGQFSSPDIRAKVADELRLANLTLSNRTGTPAERGEAFSVPWLAVRQGSLLEVFDESFIFEGEWRLSTRDALLTEEEFPRRLEDGEQYRIDVTDKGRLTGQFIRHVQHQMQLLDIAQHWTPAKLGAWIDRHLSNPPDIEQAESLAFIANLIRTLLEQRGFTLDELTADKFRLLKAVREKIAKHREAAHRERFQQILFGDIREKIVVDPEMAFRFPPSEYPFNRLYTGAHQFDKHYYPQIGDLNSGSDEFNCARFLDRLPEVECWVRNPVRKSGFSFWLQTSTDKFYPDFVCKLKDGRILVVEYKGADRWTGDDAREKRDIGELWAERSGGRCIFVMPNDKDLSAITNRIRS